ncbi:MAG: hypothetical protein KF723_17270 [Rhizobiaceae bacterium]|nr:hypothetical protein [Rhizobiaceae bacterium]
MTIQRSALTAVLLLGVALAGGCMSSEPYGGGPIAPAQTGVEGAWISTDGVAISRFSGGAFETTAADTGNKLADGSYRYTDARTVEITVVSLIRQTTTTVACALATATQLNCTTSTGQNFVLMRHTV